MKTAKINLNNDYDYNIIRSNILSGTIQTNFSFNLRPISSEFLNSSSLTPYNPIFISKNEKVQIKSMGLDYFLEYNTHHPYNRNNGTMIPNRGYQHIISPGLFFKLGPLSVQLKPEHHFSENKNFDGFWEGHYPYIWYQRYRLWNAIDMPERFGNKSHNKTTLGQSNIKLNWKSLSLGISKEARS